MQSFPPRHVRQRKPRGLQQRRVHPPWSPAEYRYPTPAPPRRHILLAAEAPNPSSQRHQRAAAAAAAAATYPCLILVDISAAGTGVITEVTGATRGTRRDGVGSRDREEAGDAQGNGDDIGPSPLGSCTALRDLGPEQPRDLLQKGRYCCSRPRGSGGGCSRLGVSCSSRVTMAATVA